MGERSSAGARRVGEDLEAATGRAARRAQPRGTRWRDCGSPRRNIQRGGARAHGRRPACPRLRSPDTDPRRRSARTPAAARATKAARAAEQARRPARHDRWQSPRAQTHCRDLPSRSIRASVGPSLRARREIPHRVSLRRRSLKRHVVLLQVAQDPRALDVRDCELGIRRESAIAARASSRRPSSRQATPRPTSARACADSRARACS